VKRFKRAIRGVYAAFLRFTHRYWFHEVSEQAQTRALFRMCTAQLGLDPLYAEVKERMHDMNAYLDADSLRRQANTVVRLTVVTIFGLVGTVTTGFLGMNLLAMGDSPMLLRVLAFGVVFAGTVALTIYTIGKSKRLSDFLDVLSEEGVPWRVRLGALVRVWERPHGG
jgi:Mg2+ and Co2+ transporter CorA